MSKNEEDQFQMFKENLKGNDNEHIKEIIEEFIEEMFGDRPMLTMDEFNKRMVSRHSWIFETDGCRKRALNYLKS